MEESARIDPHDDEEQGESSTLYSLDSWMPLLDVAADLREPSLDQQDLAVAATAMLMDCAIAPCSAVKMIKLRWRWWSL